MISLDAFPTEAEKFRFVEAISRSQYTWFLSVIRKIFNMPVRTTGRGVIMEINIESGEKTFENPEANLESWRPCAKCIAVSRIPCSMIQKPCAIRFQLRFLESHIHVRMITINFDT